MYVARTRKLRDNLSTLTLSAKPVASAMPQSIPGVDSAKDMLSKADEALSGAYKQLAGSSPVAKACLAALDTLKAPKVSARARKLAELDRFYAAGASAKKAMTSIVASGAVASDKASDSNI